MSAAPKMNEQIKFELEVTAGPHKGLKRAFSKDNVLIGRGPENDIILIDDAKVSRQHAVIKIHGANFILTKSSTKNFITLDGENVDTGILKKNSVFLIGNTEFHFFSSLINEISVQAPTKTPESAAVHSYPANNSPFTVIRNQNEVTQKKNSDLSSEGKTNWAPPKSQNSFESLPGSYPGSFPSNPYQVLNHKNQKSRFPMGHTGPNQNAKLRFYLIVGILGLTGWFFLSPNKNKVLKDPNGFRTTTESMQEVVEAEKRSQELLNLKKEKYDSIQYRRAQENFIRGFRDFQQGQYARARESFQVVLNLDPENELAKRYYQLSKIKFDELVKFNMIQGNRYREKKNWKKCQSNYFNVMSMLQNRKDDTNFKEAKQFYDECSLNIETGRY